MTTPSIPDPTLDLELVREIDISPAAVWRGWTEPGLLMQWFCPSPWRTVECEIDLRPGGRFYTVMQSPEGERFPGTGCLLEVVPQQRLTWTSALGPDYRPNAAPPDVPLFTATIALRALPGGRCLYTATVRHADAAGAEAHARMGFHEGWNAALDQLVALLRQPG